jgi:hypothetical protein
MMQFSLNDGPFLKDDDHKDHDKHYRTENRK